VTGRRIWWVILCSVFIMGAANLAATWWYVQTYKHDQQQQGQLIARKLCTTLDRLAALQPPAGNPTTNPSRAYDQRLHSTLADLGPDIGCPLQPDPPRPLADRLHRGGLGGRRPAGYVQLR